MDYGLTEESSLLSIVVSDKELQYYQLLASCRKREIVASFALFTRIGDIPPHPDLYDQMFIGVALDYRTSRST